MVIFCCLAVFYAIGSVCVFKGIRIRRDWECFIYLFPMFVLTGFRALTVGSDTLGYYRTFTVVANCQSISDAFNVSRMESGYVLINYILSHIGCGYLLFQVIIAGITYAAFYSFIRHYSTNPAFSSFIFLTMRMMFASMNLMRAYLAVAILCFAVEALINRRLIKFILIVLLAASFHTTSLFFILMYPFTSEWIKRFKDYVYVMAAGIIGLIGNQFFIRITSFTGLYAGYLNSTYFTSTNRVAVVITLLIDIAFFILFLSVKNKEFNNNQLGITDSKMQFEEKLFNICYAALLLTLGLDIVGLSNTIMDRISMYTRFLMLIGIPLSLSIMSNRRNAALLRTAIIVLLFLQFLVVMIFRPNWNSVTPYVFF